MSPPRPPRVVLHLDMDAFYAAVEVRDDPSLAGKPVIVGHRGRRGVVSTCSYEARALGVHSAMPSVTAERLCPDAEWRSPSMDVYVPISRDIRRLLRDRSPRVEPLSIDEAFVDLTGVAADLWEGLRIGTTIKRQIVREHRLTASIGVAPNKFLAKVASDMEKPDGAVLLAPEDLPTRFWPLPVERLWGVGPKTAERLRHGGLRTVGDVAHVDERALRALVGETAAAHLSALAHGKDKRAVHPDRAARSISEERTYTEDLVDPDEIDRSLLARAEGVARRLRREGLVARTVHLKVRAGDFTTWTRARTLPEAGDLAEPIVAAARELLASRVRLAGRGVRLLGLGVSGIEPKGTGQQKLFTDPADDRARRLQRAADAVRDRLGERAITRARLLRR